MRQLIDTAYGEAKAILERRANDLKAGAELLLENETITPNDFPPLRPAAGGREAAE